ncbi:MAG: valine--tRNA ligase [Beijerinckiaceae bacterium]|nr:valine--tRNA ligase [Beijerinckiaceae bacterium]
MDKTYEPKAIEARIAQLWVEKDAFKAGRPERRNTVPYSIVIPPPNVTGSLHMGHALNNTLQDILCRFERMRGKDVLWQPGTDHAGIATQMVVERKLAAEGRAGRKELGRDAFLAEVWKWKDESGGTIINQLKRLGASCDWSRERFTMDEGGSRAVAEFFVRLHEAGLIYRDKRLVNWDPKFQTAISDLEVEQREIKGHLWYFNYPIEGEVYDRENPETFITIATTRPETMLGDGAVAVHPENPRLKHMIGRIAILPLMNRRLPIIADEYADPEKGTGAVKITSAHDFNDYEVGKRHNLPLFNIMTPEAKLNDSVPEAYRGLDRYEARKRVVADIEALGLLNKIEPHTHMVPHGDRSGVVIEPLLTDQWYVDVKPLAERAMAAVRAGETRIMPANRETEFFNWLENIEPWCISRQLWWGHQIPVWYGPDGHYVVARDEDEAYLAYARVSAGEGSGASADIASKARSLQASGSLTRDTDVLDTWFSSALWPFSTMGWPDNTPELARYYPTSVLVTGFDILFFWVARMMMAGLFTQDEVPFKDVYIHGLVRDQNNKKMSKTTGNVIDPLDVIDTYGADALRFAMAALASGGRDIKLSTQRIESYRNFATKLWNSARFAEINGCERVADFDPRSVKSSLNRWVLSELSKTGTAVTESLEAYRFNEAAAAIYRFVWNTFCDWYVELSKPALQGGDLAQRSEAQATTAFIIDELAKLLHPFMPFITEELWALKGEQGPPRAQILSLTDWPVYHGLEDDAAAEEIGWLVDTISDIRSARSEMNVSAGAQIPLVLVKPSKTAEAHAVRWGDALKRLARLSEVTIADAAPAQSVQLVVHGDVLALPLAGIIDLDAERARLMKEKERLVGEIAKVDAKLANADFVARAPEEIIEENRERKIEAEYRIARIGEALRQLS